MIFHLLLAAANIAVISAAVPGLPQEQRKPASNVPGFKLSFDPTGPRVIESNVQADCQGKPFALDQISGNGVRVTKFLFGGQEMRPADLNSLNGWISELKGQVVPQILCNPRGVDVVFREMLLTSTTKPLALVEIQYVDGDISLFGKYHYP